MGKRLVKRQRIFITGRVQGVGFRPGVYQLAKRVGLCGFVFNDTRGVTIEVQGEESDIAEFTALLRGAEGPAAAEIKGFEAVDIAVAADAKDFEIKRSDRGGSVLSEVTSDIAVCSDCLREMGDRSDFRYGYPFINCTNCGPRYSIVKTVPYDRINTTMSVFAMCRRCASEYSEVSDRRFHAQPVSCGECGPRIWLADNEGNVTESEGGGSLSAVARLLGEGLIVGIKGIGGFRLCVDATNDSAVARLRERKRRDHKPFALMAENVSIIGKYAEVSERAKKVLEGVESPIVLLPKKDGGISAGAAEGVSSYGFMVCYTPLDVLVFESCREYGIDVLVMTSGNISDEPLICDNGEAVEKLGGIADAFLMHDREIYRQVDDSIVHIVEGEAVVLRRARGFVPRPIVASESSSKEIFAAGADLKNTFCLVKRDQMICSEHIGDLADARVYHHYVRSIEHLRGLFEVEPEVAVCDLHPGYLSSGYARCLEGVEVIEVQHHWGHIASVLAEHEFAGEVIGIAADGTGYGSDGAIWGCECLIASLRGFERVGHLGYYDLAGGDRASKEAIRPVFGLLGKAYGCDFKLEGFEWLFEQIEGDGVRREVIFEQLARKVNTVKTSSLGRVFDAVAAIAGLGGYNHFEAQLPMSLESIVAGGVKEAYGFELYENEGEMMVLDFGLMFRQLVEDVRGDLGQGIVSAKFHNCVCDGLIAMAKGARERSGLSTAALSGGVFCNSYLLKRMIMLLKKNGFEVLFNRVVPSNDGGIAAGQAAIAVKKINDLS